LQQHWLLLLAKAWWAHQHLPQFHKLQKFFIDKEAPTFILIPKTGSSSAVNLSCALPSVYNVLNEIDISFALILGGSCRLLL